MKFELKWLAWEVTRRCNLSCIHCRSSSCFTASQHPDCSLDQAFRLLEDIACVASPVIVLTGGEPLLRRDIFEIASYGTTLGFRMALATNGTLVTPEVCEKIIASGIQIVSLSLDGSNASIHDNFRQQPGAFDETIKATEYFKKFNIPFLINSSISERNKHDIPNMCSKAKALGARAWYMFMIVPTGRGADIMTELVKPKDYQALLEWHYAMEKEEDEILVRPTCAPQYYRIRFEKMREENLNVRSRPLSFSPGGNKGCLAGQTIALIDVDGNVLPCSYLSIPAGNVHKQPFYDIWQSSKLFKKFRDYSSYKGRCGSCEFIKVCGGCRARAYALKGDYLAEEPFCNHIPLRNKTKRSMSDTKGLPKKT